MVGDSIVRTTCFREQLPRCVWEAEGGADARAGGRATTPPSSPHCISATTPSPLPARRRLTGTPVRSRNTDELAGGRRTRRRSLMAGVRLHMKTTLLHIDAAARLFATNILQLLTLNLEKSRNNVVKISQRIDRQKTLRSMPYQLPNYHYNFFLKAFSVKKIK